MSTHERTVWIELPVQVEFTYNAAEPAETGPEAQYPGCPATIDVEAIWIGEANITAQLTDEACGEIEQAVWDAIDREREAA